METYGEFLNRINAFELKRMDLGEGDFKCSPSVALKVGKDNGFRKFYGDTVVFDLDDAVKNKLAGIVDILYREAGECFCEKLVPNTFHVTLHDLSNSPKLADIAEEVFSNELAIIEKKSELGKYADARIAMKSKYIFNMVGTSLVLGVYPADERSHGIWSEMYSVIDGVKKLGYPSTPHITLAYYNAGGFDNRAVKNLERAVNAINDELDICFELNVKNLYYQKFVSMNEYINIMPLID